MNDGLEIAKKYGEDVSNGDIYRYVELKVRESGVACADRSLFEGCLPGDFEQRSRQFFQRLDLPFDKIKKLEAHLTSSLGQWNLTPFRECFEDSDYTDYEINRIGTIYRGLQKNYVNFVLCRISCLDSDFEKIRIDSINYMDEISKIGANTSKLVSGSDGAFVDRIFPLESAVVRSLPEFMTLIDYRTPKRLFWRGEASANYLTQSKINRSTQRYYESEDFKEITRRLPKDIEGETKIEQLIQLQHYGFPTRLIDISENPLVALFFACVNDTKCNYAKILEFYPPPTKILHSDSKKAVIIGCSVAIPSSFNESDDDKRLQIKAWEESCKEDGVDLEYTDETILDLKESSIILPKLVHPRVISQSAAFIFTGDTIFKSKASWDFVKWIQRVYCIPNECKASILKELNRVGISHTTLFPDIQGHGMLLDFRNTSIIKHPLNG